MGLGVSMFLTAAGAILIWAVNRNLSGVDIHAVGWILLVVDEGARRIIVDLTDTTFIDSTMLSVLLSTLKRLRPSGGQLGIVCSDRNIRKIFEITLLDRVFPIFASRDEAIDGLVPEAT